MYSKETLSLIFKDKLHSPAEWENKYPPRPLANTAKVTRFGPSPTGFLHIGGVYTAMISKSLALQSGGTYFVRTEDTDKKREVEGVKEHFTEAFQYFDISPIENSSGLYGPYTQSSRLNIYLSYIKYLLEIGRAYPCFCGEETLAENNQKQKEEKVDLGYYGRWAHCRDLSNEEVERRIKQGEDYVIRFRCNGNPESFEFEDLIRGKTKSKNNINDIVILKSSSNKLPLPTYHLAHAVDDHLMRVNLVVRGDEWLSSVSLHYQLFDALGFDQVSYAHIAPLMKLEGKSRRKLSKRKDPEASVEYYMKEGFPAEAILSYLRGLVNSKLLDLPVQENLSTPLRLEECQTSGPLVDLVKLQDISSTAISSMSAIEIRENVYNWACKYDEELALIMKNNWDQIPVYIDTDRFNNGRVRKDLAKWSEFSKLYDFYFDDIFNVVDGVDDQRLEDYSPDVVNRFLSEFQQRYSHKNENELWFNNIKEIAKSSGFALSNKEFKEAKENYLGTLKDATTILRIVITGKKNSPSLYEVCQVLGQQEVLDRVGRVSSLS
ncbi:putative Glutamate--tRNA ligase [Vibrio nigripulchritudo SFn27]|uniref:Putative Glutamate--tRNA ligase n=1 Tax=Vibrio nigripulchritudo TaxID=28173 RepID=U4KHA9_9VIBR|nr:glutamate--tRNA ligase family protein [Vibrio nigripulchritudo]CCN85660.1 putative Glutamate--tRNA ligase [Vibrio nigripulchritudo BLFn1]CCN91072.1 putative Glutamate--tRNA ligase [Vibrio nigripulchritudo SFn27]CCN93554.1 putative Glutamate--tRNA ligase [Vibrio nigripulchritudo ENn2]CCO40079.1 putative Glutamate--tRNA ligase [Vibrio nigripulchritudo SFn135]CCO54151.1 putative Glutamate--tRNA ligase [Vibrio nigripulchritudo Wn13]